MFVWLFNAGTTTYHQLCKPFHFCRIGTRADANIHKAFVCRYSSNNIFTVVGEWHHGYFCLGYFFSSTHFDLVTRMAQKVWRDGNCIGLLANTGLFLSTGDRYLCLFQRRLIPFDSSPLLLFRFSRAWRQFFAIGVSDLYFFSPLSSYFDNWASISFDESPSCTILIRFWVDQTHVFSFCTDFRAFHPV